MKICFVEMVEIQMVSIQGIRVLDEDELKVLYQRIEDEKIIVNRELGEMYAKIGKLEKYVKDMTYFCSGVGVALIYLFFR
jgi:hypothetical protein